MREAYVVGVGMTPFARHLDRTHNDLTRESVQKALTDAGAAPEAIELAIYATVAQATMANEQVVPGQFALRAMGFQGLAVINVENACASSSTALHLAHLHVASGQCVVALAIGTEKLYSEDRARRFAIFSQAADEAQARNFLDAYSDLMLAPPDTAVAEPGQRSVLMESYAAQARIHMQRYGTTQRHLAAVAAKNHRHSRHNPLAHYRDAFTIEEVLEARSVAWPLTVPMCAPITDGSAAAIVCSKDALSRFDGSRAIKMLACVMRGGADRHATDYENHATRKAAMLAYDRARVGPGDVSVAELHDASAFGEVTETEALGLCAPGRGGFVAEAGETAIGGRIPINTSGGLESRGHPLAATGLAQIHELVTQLRGEGGARQVAGARIGLAQNGGGFIGVEEAVTCITLLGHP